MQGTTPIRVAHVMGKMLGGGVESVVMNYYRHIDRECVQFDFLVDADSTQIPRNEIENLGGRIFLIPPYQHVLAYQKELQDLCRTHKWTIIHSHINALSVFPLRAAKQAGIPIRIAHSHSTSNPEERAKTAIKDILRTQANRYPTTRFACGQVAGEWLFGKEADFWVMPNAIDLEKFSYSPELRLEIRKSLDIDNEIPVLLHIGRFMKQKNHAFLIDIFRSVLQKHPDAILLLAGDGPLHSDIQQMVNEHEITNVKFLGQIENPETLYNAADCFCLPSLYEGLPVVSVEAQASGLPILMSTDVSPEAIITSRAKTLPRSVGAEGWANELDALISTNREQPLFETDQEAIKAYDIAFQGARLTEKYLALAEENGVSIG